MPIMSITRLILGLLAMPAGEIEPREERRAMTWVVAPDGARLHVETIGPQSAPTLILTHGWGLNATAWWYTKKALAGQAGDLGLTGPWAVEGPSGLQTHH